MKVLITTVPFGDRDRTPLDELEDKGIGYVINPLGRKLSEEDLIDLVPGYDALIAGTEPITRRVLERADNLQLISRVGIGLDSVDLIAAREKKVQVCYTPDAPSAAVGELTLGLMLTLLRSIHSSNQGMHAGEWRRFFGQRIEKCSVGIIGVGRIGRLVINHLLGFGVERLLLNDLVERPLPKTCFPVSWCDKHEIYKEADLISIHTPLTRVTRGMIGMPELEMMKPGAFLINTSRGGIVNEADLFRALTQQDIAGAAIDVFEQEPYRGPLAELANCVLTAHMGSMSEDCRIGMEVEATRDVIRFSEGIPLVGKVPDEEYEIQSLDHDSGSTK